MAIPQEVFTYSDEGYDDLFSEWVAAGNGQQLLNHAEGYVYRVHRPDGVPVFVLECSTADLSVAMATKLRSWGRRGALPIEDVNPE
jgi:hypothetical protein